MKGTRTFIAAMVLTAAFAAQAQAQGVKVGIRGGINSSTFSGDGVNDETTDRRTGAVLGGFLVFSPSSFWSIQPEVLWSQMGAKGDEGGEDIELKLTYIQIPVLARVNFAGTEGGIRPHFLLGPSVSFKIGCDAEALGLSFDCDDEEFDTGIKGTDFGLVFGAGLGLPMGPGELTVDGRLYQGLSKIFEDDGSTDDDEVKNEAWQLLAGFSFPVGGRR
jgi:hypothetical protein